MSAPDAVLATATAPPPLRELWRHARAHRGKVVLATVFSVLN